MSSMNSVSSYPPPYGIHAVSLEPSAKQTKKWLDDGSIMEGTFDDIGTGSGKRTLSDGTVWEGDFQNWKLCGEGKVTQKTPFGFTFYEEFGEFKDGILLSGTRADHNKFLQIQSTSYTGIFENKLLVSGKITHSYEDGGGEIFEGQFLSKCQLLNGLGKITTYLADGQKTVLEGNFKNGELDGPGTKTVSNILKEEDGVVVLEV